MLQTVIATHTFIELKTVTKGMRTEKLQIGDNVVEAKIAENPLHHLIGMRGSREGKMFFEFPFERRWNLDMAFVRTDLYVYFFDRDKSLIEKKKATKWGLNPFKWKIYRPEKPSKYILESAEKLDLEEGQVIKPR